MIGSDSNVIFSMEFDDVSSLSGLGLSFVYKRLFTFNVGEVRRSVFSENFILESALLQDARCVLFVKTNTVGTGVNSRLSKTSFRFSPGACFSDGLGLAQ